MRAVNDREKGICQKILGGRVSNAEMVDKNIVYCKTSAKGSVRHRGSLDLVGPGAFYVDIRNRKVYRDHPNESPPQNHIDRVKWIKMASLEQLEFVIDDERKTVQRAIEARMNEIGEAERKKREHAERAQRALDRANANLQGLV